MGKLARVEPETIFQVFNEIGIIAQLSGTQFERVLPHGLTRAQFTILNWFCRVDNAASPGRLASALQVTKGAITNSLKKLEAKGFIEIRADAQSGRQKVVMLTQTGRKARDEALASAAPLMVRLSETLTSDELVDLLPGLMKLRQYLDDNRDV